MDIIFHAYTLLFSSTREKGYGREEVKTTM